MRLKYAKRALMEVNMNLSLLSCEKMNLANSDRPKTVSSSVPPAFSAIALQFATGLMICVPRTKPEMHPSLIKTLEIRVSPNSSASAHRGSAATKIDSNKSTVEYHLVHVGLTSLFVLRACMWALILELEVSLTNSRPVFISDCHASVPVIPSPTRFIKWAMHRSGIM